MSKYIGLSVAKRVTYWLVLANAIFFIPSFSMKVGNTTNASVNGQHYSIVNDHSDTPVRTCETMGPIADYGAPGPFPDVEIVRSTGPWRNYTLFRPAMESLGKEGFKHPIATWGNGIFTTPNEYKALLTHIASYGFVVIACNDIQAERPCLSAGLDWLNEQNESGPMAGKLDTTREVSIGYSWGGGAAIDVANRPNMKATVSLHGMPPREDTAFEAMHSPLLLFTSTGDSFVSKEKYVTPNYERSKVQ
ncbi:MAG: dienelactone hydrolase family protein, partial [Chromatiales bacterium]